MGSRIFNTGGDSVLAEFKSAVAAVECAVEYQDAILVRNRLTKDDQLIFRIGINMGDVIEEGGNLFGRRCQHSCQIRSIRPTGRVYFSAIYDLVKKRTNFSFVDLGQQKVKNTVLQAIDLEIPSAQPRSAKN